MEQHRVDCYYIVHNGDCWQSVFPHWQANHSGLHDTVHDAISYIHETVGEVPVIVIPAK